ncbi:unnamed protein product [Prunus armeniaca]
MAGGSQGLPVLVSLRWKGIWAFGGPVARAGPWRYTCSQTAARAILPGLDGPQLFGWMSPLEPILGDPGPFAGLGGLSAGTALTPIHLSRIPPLRIHSSKKAHKLI